MKTSEVEDADFGSRWLDAVVQPVNTRAVGVAGHDGAEPEGEVLGPLGQLAAQRRRLNPAQCCHFVRIGLEGPAGDGP